MSEIVGRDGVGVGLQASPDGELSALEERLAAIVKQAGQIKDRKGRETIPVIFGREYEENFLSNYLAYILDPKRNGVGVEPLQALLALAYEDLADIDPEHVVIIREFTFDDTSLGRIDFLIKLGHDGENGVIGIENKLYSPEGDNQTTAYAQGLAQEFPGRDRYQIFLSPSGRLPVSNEFRPISYKSLLQALREIRYPVLKDIHKCVIWEDFLAHLEEYIVMSDGKLELSGRTHLYMQNRQTLDSLRSAFESDANKVYGFVTEAIRNSLGEGWHFTFQGRNSYQEINRISWAWNFEKYYVYYQYRFSQDNILTLDQFPFMFGAYPGKHAGSFIEWLKTNYPQIPEICKAHGMNAYSKEPGEGNSALIAYKTYPLDREDITQLAPQFVYAAEEFNAAFTLLMDEAVQAYRKLMGV
jgi:hypothetical protein